MLNTIFQNFLFKKISIKIKIINALLRLLFIIYGNIPRGHNRSISFVIKYSLSSTTITVHLNEISRLSTMTVVQFR